MATNSTIALPAKIPADVNLQKRTQKKFGGLCREMIAGGEDISSMNNVVSDDYPRLSVRGARKLLSSAVTQAQINGVMASDKVYVVEGDKVYISSNNTRVECCQLKSDDEKTFVKCQKDLIILPDHLYLNGISSTVSNLRVDTGTVNGVVSGDSLKIEGFDFYEKGFSSGDGIQVVVYTGNNGMNVFSGNFVVREISDDTLYIDGVFSHDGEYRVRVMKDMPFLENAVCLGERMYGINGRSLYISEEGNIHNWKAESGFDSDPVHMISSSAGDFTACAEWNGYIILFKEGSINKLLGNKASNFILSETTAPGIPEGYGNTLVSIGGALYYCGARGVYKYDGTSPKRIDLGALPDGLIPVAAATDGEKYYLVASGRLYVYDTARQIWCAEDGSEIIALSSKASRVYMLTKNGDLLVSGPTDEEGSDEGDVTSEITFGYDDGGSAEKKSLQSLSLTVFVEKGAQLDVEVELDESGEREVIGSRTGEGVWENLTYAVKSNVCNGFRVYLRSRGKFTLASLTRNYRVIC